MKVTKTTVYRLAIERDCKCVATREYEDPRYTKAIAEATTTLCEKHSSKSEDAQEILREMLADSLSMQAEQAGKQFVHAAFRPVDEEGGGGIVATGESQEVITGIKLPDRGDAASPMAQQRRQKRDPLSITQVHVDRSDQRLPQKQASAPVDMGNLNIAGVDAGDGISITGDIDTVPEDPRLSGLVADGLGEIEDVLDEMDMKDAGVPRSALSKATD